MKYGVTLDFYSSSENNRTRGMNPKDCTSIEFDKKNLSCFIAKIA